KNRLSRLGLRSWRRRRRMRRGSVRNRCRTEAWSRFLLSQFGIKLLDLRLERGDLVVQRAGAVGNGIVLFLGPSHGHSLLAAQNQRQKNPEREHRDHHQWPRQRQADLAKSEKALPGKRIRRRLGCLRSFGLLHLP